MSGLDYSKFVAPDKVPQLTRAQCRLSLTEHPAFLAPLLGAWNGLSKQPFKGITSDGTLVEGLFSLQDDGAPTAAAAEAATRWLAMVPADLLPSLAYPVESEMWRYWQNTPLLLRPGEIDLSDLPGPLREGAMAVVRASLSAEGYDQTRRIMANNLLLGKLNSMTDFLNDWAYTFSVFGQPSVTEPWGWQLFGHHLALNCLFIGGQMVLTPMFMGAEPDVADGLPLRRIFEEHEVAALDTMLSLTDDQRAKCTLYGSMLNADQPAGRYHPDDGRTVGGAFQDNRVVPYEGVQASTLDAAQRRKLLGLAEIFVRTMPDGPAEARLREIERHLDQTYFAWIGKANDVDPFYFRIHSPVALVEFDHHSGIFLANAEPERFHVHTIVRTPNGNDFGINLLHQHYARGGHNHAAPGAVHRHGDGSHDHAVHSHDGGKSFHRHS